MPQPLDPAHEMGKLADQLYVLAHEMADPRYTQGQSDRMINKAEAIATEIRRVVRG